MIFADRLGKWNMDGTDLHVRNKQILNYIVLLECFGYFRKKIIMIEKIKSFIASIDSGFQTTDNKQFVGFYADLYAFRKGRNFVFPQRDYFFFHDIDKRNINTDIAEKLHGAAREYVNGEYKMPKAMRLTVPNITSVFVSETTVDSRLIELASKWTRSAIGGEIHQIIAVDLKSRTYYSQGEHTVRASVEGVAVKMKFSKIDPQNRAQNLLKSFLETTK